MGSHTNRHASETRCQRCDWRYGHIFHVCRDKTEAAHTQLHDVVKTRTSRGSRKGVVMSPRSDSHKAGISEAMTSYWDKVRAKNRPRDLAIGGYYMTHSVGYVKTAEHFQMHPRTVLRILKMLEAEGIIQMRPVGRNIKARKN